jgi:hypothetical protein
VGRRLLGCGGVMAYIIASEKEAFGRWFLDNIISWIKENLAPDQVWTEDEIATFVVNKPTLYFSVLEYVSQTENPADVFSVDELQEWARSHYGHSLGDPV